ncbi:hypothetical protein IV203_013983 [Nitzschia inconspicua]|uniref:Uncharacterized protein n=1 Tax=Nitzschia inconspicua TaxID=303405 RepID=A0A9K3M6D2_9STRA|nr:hypothetical protein IV203_014236 [Nitzschia inconspicua]KAG7374888.1 hypothetical protein IV203_013983 [Nitzschia inconspicua]
MGNKLPTPPLHSTHDENGEEAASDSSVATDSDDASTGSDEVDLEAEGEEASLLTNGPAYYNMFLRFGGRGICQTKCEEAERCERCCFITKTSKASWWLCHPPCPFGMECMLSTLSLTAQGSTSVFERDLGCHIKHIRTI